MEIYRVTKDSEEWLFKAYDYVRIDAFCFGQNINIEGEFSHDEPKEKANFIVIIDEHKPVAGCNITYPKNGVARIGRVCVIRGRQKSGLGRILISEAEKWIKEKEIKHIVITSQDRAAGFYKKCGYIDSAADPSEYDTTKRKLTEEEKKERLKRLGFLVVVVEKFLK